MSKRFATNKMAGLMMLLAPCAACLRADGEPAETPRYNGAGYVTFGVGRCQHQVTNINVVGGGHAFLWKGLALNGEAGYYRFAETYGRGFGIATLGAGYHFVNRKRPGRLDPFVDANLLGLGFVAGGTGAAASVGGGLNYWFKPRIGLRTEVRVHAFAEEAIAVFRIGLTFR